MNIWFITTMILMVTLFAVVFIFNHAIKRYKKLYFDKSSKRDIANPTRRVAGNTKSQVDQL